MAVTTTVMTPGGLQQAAPVEANGFKRAAAATPGGLNILDDLVEQVLGCPDGVSDEILAEAVRGLEALGGESLGVTVGDARVLLQRRFGRALGRAGWTSGGA